MGSVLFLTGNAAARSPNIIYILADDLGYGDLSCYGQDVLRTPHLDRLAAEGVRFTRHYAGSTVCAPSRCVLMTGLHTGHARIRGNGPGRLKDEDVTFATRLREAGYHSGAFGKWGIGNPPPLEDPNRHGFDEFYGYVNMFHAHNFYPEFLVHNGERVPLRNRLFPEWKAQQTPEREGRGVAEVAVDYAPALIRDTMLDYIRSHRNEPFFVYYALNIPHANNEAGGEERIGRNGMRVPDWGDFAENEWPAQEKGFASMIHAIDSDVGAVLALLEELELDEETLVMFSSDNGPHQEGGHRVDFFNSNGALRGKKRDLYEGGVRVPFIARWPGTIPAGRVEDTISGFQDIFPTVLELAGVPNETATDGISLAPAMLGRPNQGQRDYLYWEFFEQGGKRAALMGNWKAVQLGLQRNPDGPIALFNLEDDPGEVKDLAGERPELVQRARRIFQTAHTEIEP